MKKDRNYQKVHGKEAENEEVEKQGGRRSLKIFYE
jgi:hypothetical protein